MKRGYHFLEDLANSVDLPGETIPGQPIVEVAGERRVLIENHFGVVQYTQEQICVKVKFGEVSVCGCGLDLTRMTKNQLVITGRIDSISLVRRRK